MMSSIRRSLGVLAGTSALLLGSGFYYSQAQEPARSKATPKTAKKAQPPVVDDEDEAPPPKSASKKSDPHRRLYAYFGQLGLTEAQKNTIYDIRAKHAPKIDALEKQLEEERAHAMAEAERVLNPSQKKLLEERRKAAAAKSSAEAKEKAEEASKDGDQSKPAASKRRRDRDR